MNIEALHFLALEIFNEYYDNLTETQKEELQEELEFRDSMGWRN